MSTKITLTISDELLKHIDECAAGRNMFGDKVRSRYALMSIEQQCNRDNSRPPRRPKNQAVK